MPRRKNLKCCQKEVMLEMTSYILGIWNVPSYFLFWGSVEPSTGSLAEKCLQEDLDNCRQALPWSSSLSCFAELWGAVTSGSLCYQLPVEPPSNHAVPVVSHSNPWPLSPNEPLLSLVTLSSNLNVLKWSPHIRALCHYVVVLTCSASLWDVGTWETVSHF